MNFFDIVAKAAPDAAAQASQGGILGMIVPFVLIFAVMYFLMIRPQKKKDKLKQEMLSQLIVGDKILTIGGIHGKIVSIKDDTLILETGGASASEKSFIKISRWAVGEVTKPGDAPKEAKQEEISETKEDK